MKPRRLGMLALGLMAVFLPGRSALAQGFLVDRHFHRVPVPVARAYEIREVSIDARVRDQVAEVRVAQTFHNPGSTEIEAEYLFPLPDDAGVQNLVLMVDGRELPGRLLPKDEARRIYEEIVRTKRDPALLEYMGRGLFRASVFPIPPGADRQVTLRYTQLCKRDRDVVEFAYPLGTQKHSARPIQKLALTVSIENRDPIKSVYCPTHDASISRPGEREVKATLERRDVLPTEDFRLVYTLAEGALGATVLSYQPNESEDGYFLLLASPRVKPVDSKPLPKTVVFVIDRSGSMAGKKLEQARAALQSVLNNLRDDDTFNIIAYDDRVEAFKPELQRYSSSTRAEAEKFVANIREGGSTNIDGALKASLTMIPDDSRPGYVIFLTDGLPTAGETSELKIAENGKASNKSHARIFAFGVGFDVNARLLDRLSGGNGGTSEYVRPDEDIEAHVGAFYSKITRPALASIAVEFTGTDVNRTYPRDIPDLFEGGQLVWVGRYRKSGPSTVRLSGKVGADRQSFEFPTELAGPRSSTGYDFVEKLWAVRRVGFIIDQIDLNGPNKELTDELVALSTKYGLLTPYTSFLADERVNLHASAENNRRATLSLDALQVVQGQAGTSQRAMKQLYNKAESFEEAKYAYSAVPASPGSAGGMPALGRGMAGMMGGIGGRSAGGAMPGMMGPGSAPAQPAQNVRNLGAKTFYRKSDRWVDAEVKPEEDEKAIVLEQFSEEFFKVVRNQSPAQNQYFTFEEPVTVAIEGRVYRIDPPRSK
ncbi:VIT domain-containing protein [Tundrisphaera lichenicola]|uniref:VIT domain-containing protein n=1 Tax=Tundrisphaera lichenicola TaxID=2029860 RepID=UPI003EB6C258